MMGMDGGRRLFEKESLKPKDLGETLRRFGSYFRRHWTGALLAILLITGQAWTQVVTPELIGQSVDCYLFPRDPGTCWFSDITLDMEQDVRIQGLGKLVLVLLGLNLAGSVLAGMAFYAMSWTGQHVLRQLRQDLFRQIHRLSMGFYARNEAGDIMSRVTNDSDTIEQAFSFALMQVISGALLIVWIMVRMLETNVTYALISLGDRAGDGRGHHLFLQPGAQGLPSGASGKWAASTRTCRKVSPAHVRRRPSTAKTRPSRNFERSNAANRAANVRAAAFTSALSPVLEALGFVALAIVVLAGGIAVLRNEPLMGGAAISLGTVFAFVAFSQRFSQPISQIAVLWTNVQSAIAGGERIFGLMDEGIEIVDKPDAIPMPKIRGEVRFERVNAEYIAGETVLNEISFVAQPGEIVAIVGPTGAGKTTYHQPAAAFLRRERGRGDY